MDEIKKYLPPLLIEVSFKKIFSYLHFYNGYKLIDKIVIKNTSLSDFSNLLLNISCLDKDLVSFKKINIPFIKKDEVVEIDNFDLSFNLDLLKEIKLAKDTKLFFEIVNENNEILVSTFKDIKFISLFLFSTSFFELESLVSFITPNNKYNKNLAFEAKNELKFINNSDIFFAYQNYDREDLLSEINVLYKVFSKLNISLINLPLLYLENGIKIRRDEEIYFSKRGTELDLALFFASLCEYFSFNPLLIFYKNKVFVGVWDNQNTFYSPLIESNEDIKFFLNADKIIPLDLSLIFDKKTSLRENIEHTKKLLLKEDEGITILDVKTSRKNDYYPLSEDILNKEEVDKISFNKESENLEDVNLKLSSIKNEYFKNKDRFSYWEKKLLDLSKNNKLINMKIGTNTIQLLTASIYDLLYSLSNFDNKFTLLYKEDDSIPSSSRKNIYDIEKNKTAKQRAQEYLVRNKIEILLNEKEYFTSIPNLYRKVRNELEESGSNTLFIAFGTVSWKENPSQKSVFHAPILLLPVEIKKTSNKLYQISLIDQEPFLNTSFFSYLKEEFASNFDLNYELPRRIDNPDIIDLIKVMNDVKKEVLALKGFKVEEVAFLGRFSFSKFIMWNDIRNRKQKISENLIVKSFLNGKKEWQSKINITQNDIDNVLNLRNLAIPLSSDSSQIEAIMNSSIGESFVMIGPPGTGKSQTIANIIVNALYNNKKVLFCSEKKAALDVVYSRLKQVKIDPFCLELHSNKQDKKVVLSALEKVLELGEIDRKKEFTSLIDNINYLKNELREIIKKVHLKGDYSLSLYEAILKFEDYKEIKGDLDIPLDFILHFNKSKETEVNDLFQKGVLFSKNFENFDKNPFSIIKNRDYSLEIKNELAKLLERTIKSLKDFLNIYEILNKSLKIENLDDKTIARINRLFDYLDKEDVYFEILKDEDASFRINKIKEMIILEEKHLKSWNKLLTIFDSTIELMDINPLFIELKQANDSSFIKKVFIKNKILSKIKKYSLSNKNFERSKLDEYIELLKDHNDNKNIVYKNSILLEKLLKGDYYRNETNEFNKLLHKLDATEEFNGVLKKISNKEEDARFLATCLKDLIEANASKETINEYQYNYRIIKENLSTLTTKYKFDFSSFKDSFFLKPLLENFENINKNIDNLSGWSELLTIFDRFDNLGLKNIKEEYYINSDFSDVYNLFNKSLYKKIIEKLIYDNHLEKFNGENLNFERNSYERLHDIYKKDVINEVVAKLSENVPTSYKTSVNSSEVGILKKAIKSNGRGMSLRKILSLISETLLKITPCVLVSPLSCAKYLDPDLYNFDLVIFDEASQIPTSNAIGVISRGKSLIIAGDDKQLPPTSFFDKQMSDNEDELFVSDLESVLDDAISISFPIKHLLYHYRSKNESLIAFSNNRFYDNELYTFPSIDDINSKVHFKLINGTYDLGRSATNKEEADAIVNDLIYRIKNDEFDHSYGIITFSIHQMELIERMLEDEIDKDKELYDKVLNLKEPIFVKNLENVQGDERDIIYLSVCYGRDKNGRFVQNFGPINNNGGYRRLNVAITRSREEMIVYSSISYNEINLNKTNSDGVRFLKEFLEYAQYGPKVLTNKNSFYQIKDGIEDYLAKDLIEKGYKVETHLGTSKFKIDIAIINPKNPNKYLLAIILDSYSYISTPTVEDRNIIQFDELNSLGWKVLMVWTLDYFNNRTKVIKNIEEEIEKALEASPYSYSKEIDFSSIEFKKLEKKEETALKPYLIYTLKNYYTEKQFLNLKNREKIFKIIKNIIDVEYPISKTQLIKKINTLFQIKRKNRENSGLINYFLNKLNNPYNYSYYSDNIFYFKDGYDDFKISFYRKADLRNIEDIAKEEIEVLIIELLKKNISIEKEAIKKEVVIKLGFKSKTKKIDECLDFTLNYMEKDKKEIKINENGYIELVK